MIQNGHIGQVIGPFTADQDLLSDNGAIGKFTPENERLILYKIGIQSDIGTKIKVNGSTIKIGKTGIYELDDLIKITDLRFPEGASSDTIIDFVYQGRAY